MSDIYGTGVPEGTRPGTGTPDHSTGASGDAHGKADAAKAEAADLKDTVVDEASGVVGTAKDEAASVAKEAKSQAGNLLHQTTREFSDQLQNQQQRLSGGLRSAGDDLRSMADSSEGGGVAHDVVREVSRRVDGIGAWLGDRSPSSVLDEVKRYARRKPGTFIVAAAVAGLAVGRLSRALASGAREDSSRSGSAAGGDSRATAYQSDRTRADEWETGTMASGGMGSDRLVGGSDVPRTGGVPGAGNGPGTGGTAAGVGAVGAGGAASATGAGDATGLNDADAFSELGFGQTGVAPQDTPLYDQTASPLPDAPLEGGDHDRRDTL